MSPSRIGGELLSLRFPPGQLAQRIYELEDENERLRKALAWGIEHLPPAAGYKTLDGAAAIAEFRNRAQAALASNSGTGGT